MRNITIKVLDIIQHLMYYVNRGRAGQEQARKAVHGIVRPLMPSLDHIK